MLVKIMLVKMVQMLTNVLRVYTEASFYEI